MILMEYYESGNFCKSHQRGSMTDIPLEFESFYLRYREFVNTLPNVQKSKERKLWVMSNYLSYLKDQGICDVGDSSQRNVHEYVSSLTDFAASTRRCIATILREALDWAKAEGITEFSGRQALPVLRKEPRTRVLSYYTKDEIMRTLGAIDTDTKRGRLAYLAISLMAHLGMRAGDVINLRFDEIDWQNDSINIIQQKTGVPLSLPLVDEVKFPLADYLKNARHESRDEDYILVTCYAPYTRINHTSTLYGFVSRYMGKAGIDTKDRHHGPHALRHSLATGLMQQNVPISAISNILGHSSTRTTEVYLTVDTTHLAELSLEVPDVF
jgi:integrase